MKQAYRFIGYLMAPVLIAGLLVDPAANAPRAAGNSECVILLHGLARSSRSMDTIEARISKRGYQTVNVDYPSTRQTIEQLAVQAIPDGIKDCHSQGTETIHFVTHSMGGILVRYYLAARSLPDLGKVVMLAPPNQGSEAADSLKDNLLFKWLNGPAGQQLGTDESSSLPLRLGPVYYPVGIISGNESSLLDSWLSEIIPGEDDGKVSVDRAQVRGMSDFLVLPHAHTFIMNKPDVISQTIHFLEHGRFDHSNVDH